jgi:hypothetical protein
MTTTEDTASTWEEVRELALGYGTRFDVEMAYPFPVLIGYEHLTTDDIAGEVAAFRGKTLGTFICVDEGGHLWWVDVADFEILKASEGSIWDLSERLTGMRDLELLKRRSDELGLSCALGSTGVLHEEDSE